MSEQDELSEKMAAFVGAHRRVLDDFGRSLANSRHFIKLADRTVEKEPEETVTLLEQIKDIDLVGHLSRQHEEFRAIAGFFLPTDGAPPPQESPLLVEVSGLESRYEALLEEAEGQMASIDKLLFALQTQH